MATGSPVEDQGRLLEEALGVVRQQSQQMRRCLETPGKLMDALKCGYGPFSEPSGVCTADPNATLQVDFGI